MESPTAYRLQLAAELREDLRLPSDSQRLPSDSQRVAISPRDWQLLPLPSKQWATVSMIDTVWEKLTKVSDEVSELQVAVAQPPNDQTEMEEVRKALLELTEALQAQDHSLRGVEERLGILHAQPKDDHRMELEGLRRELQELRVGHEEGLEQHRAANRKALDQLKSGFEEGREPTQQLQDQHGQLRRDVEQLKLSLEASQQRFDQRLKSSQETVELSQSSGYEKLRLQLQQQMQQELERQELSQASGYEKLRVQVQQQMQQEVDRQDQSLGQLKQRLNEERDEAAAGLRRLQKQLDALEGEERSLGLSVEEIRRGQDSSQQEMRWMVKCANELQSSLEWQLAAVKQESGARLEELAQGLVESVQCTEALKEKLSELGLQTESRLRELRGHVEDQATAAQADASGRLKELEEREVASRLDLEERSEELLDLGLQKLAREVAERMDRQQEQQRLASLAAENRLSGHLESCYQRLAQIESWRSGSQERESTREGVLKRLQEQMAKLEGSELPALQSRLDELRRGLREDLAASAMNSFQGEMRLWAKMAQMGIAPPS